MRFDLLEKLSKSDPATKLLLSELDNSMRSYMDGPAPSLTNTYEAYQTTKPAHTKIDGIIITIPDWPMAGGKHIHDAFAAMDSGGRRNRLGAVVNSGPHAGTRYHSSYKLMPISVLNLVMDTPELASSDLGRRIVQLREEFPDNAEFGRAINRLTNNQVIDDLLMDYKIKGLFKILKDKNLPVEKQVEALAYGHRYGPRTMNLLADKNLEHYDHADYLAEFKKHLGEDTDLARMAVNMRNLYYNLNTRPISQMRVQEELNTDPEELTKGFGKKVLGIGALGAAFVAGGGGPKLMDAGKAIGHGIESAGKHFAQSKTGRSLSNAMAEAGGYKHTKEELDLQDFDRKHNVPKFEGVPEFVGKPRHVYELDEMVRKKGLTSDKGFLSEYRAAYRENIRNKLKEKEGQESKKEKMTYSNATLGADGKYHAGPTEPSKNIWGPSDNKPSEPAVTPKATAVPEVKTDAGDDFKFQGFKHYEPKPFKFGEAPSWSKDTDYNVYDAFAAAESGGHENRVHQIITNPKSTHYRTRAYSSYGLMPKTVLGMAQSYPEVRDSELGKKIRDIGSRYAKDPVTFGRKINEITKDRKVDDFLAEQLLTDTDRQLTQKGFKRGTPDYYKALGYSHMYGMPALSKVLSSSNPDLTDPSNDPENYLKGNFLRRLNDNPTREVARRNRLSLYGGK